MVKNSFTRSPKRSFDFSTTIKNTRNLSPHIADYSADYIADYITDYITDYIADYTTDYIVDYTAKILPISSFITVNTLLSVSRNFFVSLSCLYAEERQISQTSAKILTVDNVYHLLMAYSPFE